MLPCCFSTDRVAVKGALTFRILRPEPDPVSVPQRDLA